jgi:hypothetical protein
MTKIAFGHHFDEVSRAEFESQMPVYAEDDVSWSKWRPLKRSSMLVIQVRSL